MTAVLTWVRLKSRPHTLQMTADRLDSMKVLAVVKVMDEGRETRHVAMSENNGAKCSLI